MVYVKVKKGEPIERALKRFSKKVKNSGLFYDLKKHEYYRDKNEMKKFKQSKKRRSKR